MRANPEEAEVFLNAEVRARSRVWNKAGTRLRSGQDVGPPLRMWDCTHAPWDSDALHREANSVGYEGAAAHIDRVGFGAADVLESGTGMPCLAMVHHLNTRVAHTHLAFARIGRDHRFLGSNPRGGLHVLGRGGPMQDRLFRHGLLEEDNVRAQWLRANLLNWAHKYPGEARGLAAVEDVGKLSLSDIGALVHPADLEAYRYVDRENLAYLGDASGAGLADYKLELGRRAAVVEQFLEENLPQDYQLPGEMSGGESAGFEPPGLDLGNI